MRALLLVAAALCWIVPLDSRAAGVIPSSLNNPNQLAPLADVFIKSVGLVTAHRPYEPATPLGSQIGLDLGVEITLLKAPSELADALTQLGANLPIAVLPIPRFHLHKGLGEWAEFGVALISFHGYRIYGGDFKVAVSMPSEGPTWALRLGYSDTKMEWVSTRTWSPQLLVSRKLDFADPYLGLGWSFSTGHIDYPLTFNGVSLGSLHYDGKGSSFGSFIGIQFKVPSLGLRIVLEGSYSAQGAHGIGTNIGFGF